LIDPQGLWILARAVVDSALMLLWGCCGFFSAAVPSPLSALLMRRFSGVAATCTTMVVTGILAVLAAQVAIVTDGWRATLDRQTLWSLLTLTTSGRAWDILAAGSFLLALGRWLMPRSHALTAVLAGCALASLSLTGHAAMTSGPKRILHAGIDTVHVLSAGAWLGGLVGFVFVMLAARDVAHRPQAIVALSRFSTLGHVAVALAILSGVANSLLILGHLPTDWRSPYQARLLVKIGLVAIMSLVAAVDRYVFVPLLRRRRRAAEAALLAGAAIELLLGVVVVALVAAFGTMDPS